MPVVLVQSVGVNRNLELCKILARKFNFSLENDILTNGDFSSCSHPRYKEFPKRPDRAHLCIQRRLSGEVRDNNVPGDTHAGDANEICRRYATFQRLPPSLPILTHILV